MLAPSQPKHIHANVHRSKGEVVSEYRVIEVIGTSPSSWEEAAAEAITAAGESVRLIRVAE
jgi:flavin-binding protein dodecin